MVSGHCDKRCRSINGRTSWSECDSPSEDSEQSDVSTRKDRSRERRKAQSNGHRNVGNRRLSSDDRYSAKCHKMHNADERRCSFRERRNKRTDFSLREERNRRSRSKTSGSCERNYQRARIKENEEEFEITDHIRRLQRNSSGERRCSHHKVSEAAAGEDYSKITGTRTNQESSYPFERRCHRSHKKCDTSADHASNCESYSLDDRGCQLLEKTVTDLAGDRCRGRPKYASCRDRSSTGERCHRRRGKMARDSSRSYYKSGEEESEEAKLYRHKSEGCVEGNTEENALGCSGMPRCKRGWWRTRSRSPADVGVSRPASKSYRRRRFKQGSSTNAMGNDMWDSGRNEGCERRNFTSSSSGGAGSNFGNGVNRLAETITMQLNQLLFLTSAAVSRITSAHSGDFMSAPHHMFAGSAPMVTSIPAMLPNRSSYADNGPATQDNPTTNQQRRINAGTVSPSDERRRRRPLHRNARSPSHAHSSATWPVTARQRKRMEERTRQGFNRSKETVGTSERRKLRQGESRSSSEYRESKSRSTSRSPESSSRVRRSQGQEVSLMTSYSCSDLNEPRQRSSSVEMIGKRKSSDFGRPLETERSSPRGRSLRKTKSQDGERNRALSNEKTSFRNSQEMHTERVLSNNVTGGRKSQESGPGNILEGSPGRRSGDQRSGSPQVDTMRDESKGRSRLMDLSNGDTIRSRPDELRRPCGSKESSCDTRIDSISVGPGSTVTCINGKCALRSSMPCGRTSTEELHLPRKRMIADKSVVMCGIELCGKPNSVGSKCPQVLSKGSGEGHLNTNGDVQSRNRFTFPLVSAVPRKADWSKEDSCCTVQNIKVNKGVQVKEKVDSTNRPPQTVTSSVTADFAASFEDIQALAASTPNTPASIGTPQIQNLRSPVVANDQSFALPGSFSSITSIPTAVDTLSGLGISANFSLPTRMHAGDRLPVFAGMDTKPLIKKELCDSQSLGLRKVVSNSPVHTSDRLNAVPRTSVGPCVRQSESSSPKQLPTTETLDPPILHCGENLIPKPMHENKTSNPPVLQAEGVLNESSVEESVSCCDISPPSAGHDIDRSYGVDKNHNITWNDSDRPPPFLQSQLYDNTSDTGGCGEMTDIFSSGLNFFQNAANSGAGVAETCSTTAVDLKPSLCHSNEVSMSMASQIDPCKSQDTPSAVHQNTAYGSLQELEADLQSTLDESKSSVGVNSSLDLSVYAASVDDVASLVPNLNDVKVEPLDQSFQILRVTSVLPQSESAGVVTKHGSSDSVACDGDVTIPSGLELNPQSIVFDEHDRSASSAAVKEEASRERTRPDNSKRPRENESAQTADPGVRKNSSSLHVDNFTESMPRMENLGVQSKPVQKKNNAKTRRRKTMKKTRPWFSKVMRNSRKRTVILFKCQYPSCNYVSLFTKNLRHHHEKKHPEETKIIQQGRGDSLVKRARRRSKVTENVERRRSQRKKTSVTERFPDKGEIAKSHDVTPNHTDNTFSNPPDPAFPHAKTPMRVRLFTPRYQCPYCSKTFKTVSAKRQHELSHSEEKPYQCSLCQYAGRSRSNLLKHVTMKHGSLSDLSCQCAMCFKILLTPDMRIVHEQSHLIPVATEHLPKTKAKGGRKLKCAFCPVFFDDETSRATHEHLHRQQAIHCDVAKRRETSHARYMCHFCPKSFTTSFGRSGHELIHKGIKPYKCRYCDHRVRQKTRLKHHELLHTRDDPFKCSQCTVSFPTSKSLAFHVSRMHRHKAGQRRKQRYRTEPAQSTNSSSLSSSPFKTNPRISPSSERFTDCNYAERRPVQLYKCDQCDYSVRQKSKLRLHDAIHNRDAPHKCAYCTASFLSKSGLRMHLRQVHGQYGSSEDQKSRMRSSAARDESDRTDTSNSSENIETAVSADSELKARDSYTCMCCSKTFTQRGALTIHERSHTGEKPFQCRYCGYRSTQKCNIKAHEKRIHGNEKEPVKCPLCCFSCNEKSGLALHVRENHEIAIASDENNSE